MSNRNISDPKLFFASLQAQFDIFVNHEKPDERQANQLSELDHELDSLMGNMYHHPSVFIQKHPSHPALQEQEGDVLAEKHRSSSPYLATSVKEAARLSIDSGPSYFNALGAVFSVATIMILAVSWSFWPTSHWNWPYAPSDEVQRVDIAVSVASAKAIDAIESVASVEAIASTESVASIEVTDTATEKSELLNTVLAANPTGAGNKVAPVQQNQVMGTILRIVPPIGRIRSEPGLRGKVVARLEHGSLVVALGRQGDWLRVRLPDNQEAWAYKTIVAPTVNEEDKGRSIDGVQP